MRLGFTGAGKKKKKLLWLLSFVFWVLECVNGVGALWGKRQGFCCYFFLWVFLKMKNTPPESHGRPVLKRTRVILWADWMWTVLCCVATSERNQGSSSFSVMDWKRQAISYWWALVVQGETHASFKEIASYSLPSVAHDNQANTKPSLARPLFSPILEQLWLCSPQDFRARKAVLALSPSLSIFARFSLQTTDRSLDEKAPRRALQSEIPTFPVDPRDERFLDPWESNNTRMMWNEERSRDRFGWAQPTLVE